MAVYRVWPRQGATLPQAVECASVPLHVDPRKTSTADRIRIVAPFTGQCAEHLTRRRADLFLRRNGSIVSIGYRVQYRDLCGLRSLAHIDWKRALSINGRVIHR